MSHLRPRTHYQHKVDVWRRLFNGYYRMDTDIIQIIGRFSLSAFMLYLVLSGSAVGWIGVPCATITSGIDLAAGFEALRESQTNDGRDVDYTSDPQD